MSKSTTNAVLGFLAGAAAGTITGLLFAPEKGSKTRKKIKRKAERAGSDIRSNLGYQVEDMKDYITSFTEDIQKRFNTLEKEVKEQAKETVKNAKRTASAAADKAAEKSAKA